MIQDDKKKVKRKKPIILILILVKKKYFFLWNRLFTKKTEKTSFFGLYTYYVKIPNRKHNQQKKNNNPKLVNQVQKRNAGLVQETKIWSCLPYLERDWGYAYIVFSDMLMQPHTYGVFYFIFSFVN